MSDSLSIRALGLGFVCGMRSLLGPALVRPTVARHAANARVQSAAASPVARFLIPALAAGELIGDKLPGTPNRTIIPSVVFRAASGASVGAGLYGSKNKPLLRGALWGAAGALAATYGVFYLRRAASQRKIAPDLVLGLVEDAAAIGMGLLMLRGTDDAQN